MKNIAILLVGMLGQAGGLMAQKNVVIKGTVTGDTKGYKKVYLYGQNIKSDSTLINNGNFQFTIPYKEGMVPLLYDEYDMRVLGGMSPYPVLVDRPGVVYLKGIDIAKGMASGTISGLKSAMDYQAYSRQAGEVSRQISEELKKKYGTKIKPGTPEYNAYVEEWGKLNKERSAPLVEKTIKADPDAYVSAYVLGSEGRRLLETDELERLFNILTKKAQQTKPAKSLAEFINGSKKSAVGQYVENFTLRTPEDKPLQFQELKGKYLVLDFWASWCGPCIKSFPHMKAVYKKYKSDQFEICSISVDQSKSAWHKAMKEQDLPWIQGLDTSNVSVSHFAVTGIPTVYLIDPSGKILAKETGFEENGQGAIEKKLIELFGEK